MTLKQRIEALDNGWDVKADCILQEILPSTGNCYFLKIPAWKIKHCGSIEILLRGKGMASFSFTSQCSKHQAFKDALLWLLDKSGLEKVKEGDTAKVEVEGKMWEAQLVKRII